MNVITLGVIIGLVMGVGAGGFYLVWLKTRPKKETWRAEIFQLGDGVKDKIFDKDGNIIKNIELKDLKPYALDTLEKIEKEPGITIYKLQKLNKTTPPIEGDVVDYWGKENKKVTILKTQGTFTILKKGYDNQTASLIFYPLSLDRINMMKSEMAIRKDRLTKEKDILQAITPWIIAGICMMGLIGLTYILVAGFTEITEELTDAEKYHADRLVEIEEKRGGTKPTVNPVGKQDPPPPLIEGDDLIE